MKRISVTSYYALIHMAGDYRVAKQKCREFCLRVGLCVQVSRADYVYTGGEEAGFLVRLTNYPRFPSGPEQIREKAALLALELKDACCQRSFTVEFPDETDWYSWREDDNR